MPVEKLDLSEPNRLLRDLGIYDLVVRMLRVCKKHGFATIKDCKVSEEVRRLMRSLFCVEHPDVEGTLEAICEQGGDAGTSRSSPMQILTGY